GFNESDIRIRGNLFSRLGKKANERIVGSVQDEGRHRDLFDDVRSRSAGIVIVCAGETTIVGGHLVVEFAQAAEVLQAGAVEVIREQLRFAHHAAAQVEQKIFLVKTVGRIVQGVGGGGKVHRRATGGNRTKLLRNATRPFTRKFQDKVAAHREADERQMRDA